MLWISEKGLRNTEILSLYCSSNLFSSSEYLEGLRLRVVKKH